MSNEKVFIVGHKSPDLDSVAAAITYANLKNILEKTDKYIAMVPGELNAEAKYALEKFDYAIPDLLEDGKDKQIILVDHNEMSQAISGLDEAKILGILDHHKVDFKHGVPINIKTQPVGSTCTMIAEEYFYFNIPMDKNLAGLMLSAILVDTVITKSPTCTDLDIAMIEKLSAEALISDWKAFGLELFKIRSSVGELSDKDIIKTDFKDFELKQGKFGIGQVETVSLDEFTARYDSMIEEMKKIQQSEGYHSVILFITDIINEGSQFLVATSDQEKVEAALNKKLDNGKVYIEGIISRKKQVAPKFVEVFDK
jgi:manganese-dependent inorganic pyrophosphatase